MTPVPVSPRRVFGVDFSGARDAGRSIWICRGHPGPEGVRVESVDPLADLPGGAVDRRAALHALVQKVLEAPRSAWGFDFSFGLPRQIAARLAPAGTIERWEDQLDAVASLEDADVFRARCREVRSESELRRATDEEASTPFSPYNLRVYRQTFHGMSEVLQPLRGHSEVAVLPFDPLPAIVEEQAAQLPANVPAPGQLPHVYVMEVCPASVLTALGYPRKGYKGGGSEETERRRSLLRRLVDDGLVRPMARALRGRIVDGSAGDGLDALLAAVGAWRGCREYDHAALRTDPRYSVEGFVYT